MTKKFVNGGVAIAMKLEDLWVLQEVVETQYSAELKDMYQADIDFETRENKTAQEMAWHHESKDRKLEHLGKLKKIIRVLKS